MLKNFWGEDKEFYCMNHDEPVRMYVYEGASSPFYACKRYMLKDDEHPDGHELGEQACSNRLSFNMAIGIIDHIMKMGEQDLSGYGFRKFVGWRFKYKNIEVKILECDNKGNITKIGIKNKSEIQGWKNL